MIGSLHRSPTLPDREDPFSVSTLCASAGTRADESWPVRHPLGSRLSNEPADPFHLARFPDKPGLRTNNLLLCIDTNCMPLQEAGKLSAAMSFQMPQKTSLAGRFVRRAEGIPLWGAALPQTGVTAGGTNLVTECLELRMREMPSRKTRQSGAARVSQRRGHACQNHKK